MRRVVQWLMLGCRECCSPVVLYRSGAEQIRVFSPPAGIAGVVVVGVSPSAEGWKPLTLTLGARKKVLDAIP